MQMALFTYKLRLIFGKWTILLNDQAIEADNYIDAQELCNRLQERGYIDSDRG